MSHKTTAILSGSIVALALAAALALEGRPHAAMPPSGPQVPFPVCELLSLPDAARKASFPMFAPEHPLAPVSAAKTDLCENSSFTRFESGIGLIVEPAEPPDAAKLLRDIAREDSEYRHTTIRGQPALYVVPSDRSNGGFMWYEDGLHFSVSGNKRIGLAALRAVADSLKRVE